MTVIGSTGSIGRQTLEVIKHLGFEVAGLGCGANHPLLAEQIKQFRPQIVSVADENALREVRKQFPKISVCDFGELAGVGDSVIIACSGAIGLGACLSAIDAGKTIGLANKEVLVAAGEFVMGRVKEKGISLIPIDSEHSALFQCLETGEREEIEKLILTASGGPFRHRNDLGSITVDDALAHPTWSMGPKISVDSSTMMNKGLEVIEARWLFDIPYEQIEVVIHPQSVIHSLVQWTDGAMIAQMSAPSMHLPIQYALTYPKRVKGMMGCFDFTKYPKLEFQLPDLNRFRCLQLAFDALKEGGSMPCFMNASNEVLVQRFLQKEINWQAIGEKLERLMQDHKAKAVTSIEDVVEIDKSARGLAKKV